MEYGASLHERARAEIDKKPESKPQLRGPIKNGYDMKPTFVVDSDRKRVTVTWAESEADAKARQYAKAKKLPYPSLLSATEATIILFTSDHIAAIQVHSPTGVTVYSFFPKLGTAFITTQGNQPSGKDTQQSAFFATCSYSWSGSR